jgi:hypothetical protein
MDTANLEQQLLKWKFVPSEQEHEKYFRYAAFRIKWLKITRQRDKVLLYINSFIENSHRGIDVVVSLVSLIKSTNDEAILAELLVAATVISDRNLKGLTKKEIAEAERIANAIWKRAVFEESYHEALGE